MAQSAACVPSLRFNSLVTKNHPNFISEPTFAPLRSRKVSKLRSNQKAIRTSSVKAVYSNDYTTLDKNSKPGIWSIREDVQVPSSPYFPTYAQGQGPPPMMQERFQSVISQLFQYRIIRCGGAVDDDMANIIVAQLLYLDAVDPNKDIIMYVNSPGGSVTAGMAIFDTMKHIRPDVSTVCVGLAASMGAFLLGAGTKGKRYSLPNSRIMIHQPLGGAQGGQTDLDIQANEMLHHKANLNGYLAYHTGQSLDRINQDTDRDYFMSAKEAKEYGLIDGVIMNPLKALQPLPAAYMGAFLLGAGTKGKRYSLPNSRIMIHQPLGGAQGGQTDLDIQANEILHHKANLNGYLAYHTGQSLDRINQDTDRDYFMSAKEAKEYGLIDGVIMNPLKALQPLPAA